MITRPSDTEYAAYFSRYVTLVPEPDILTVLVRQPADLSKILATVSAERERFRYAAGKWSIREVAGHLIDAERVFGYRAFCISRGERVSLPKFDENAYVAESRYDEYLLGDLLAEFALVRNTNLAFLSHLMDQEWTRIGSASNIPVSVRALAWIMAGHVRHHCNVLQEKYGVKVGL